MITMLIPISCEFHENMIYGSVCMQDSDYYDEILPHQYAMSEMGGNPMKGFRNR